ncbi:MAG: PIN domain-containing protein [archaeon]|nr:PIN domain-containing protein [archaeon]
MKVLVDSSAWIEYLEGSELGKKVRELIISNNEIYSLSIIIAEVVSKVKRTHMNAELAYETIISNSLIINTSSETAKQAGLLHAELKNKINGFSLADAFILTSARQLKASILTKDSHLQRFKEAIKLK